MEILVDVNGSDNGIDEAIRAVVEMRNKVKVKDVLKNLIEKW